MSESRPWRLSTALQSDRPLAETLRLDRPAEKLGSAEAWINENGAFTTVAAVASITSATCRTPSAPAVQVP